MSEAEITLWVRDIETQKSPDVVSFGHWLLENYTDLDRQHPDHVEIDYES
jgi:hypothetical protein